MSEIIKDLKLKFGEEHVDVRFEDQSNAITYGLRIRNGGQAEFLERGVVQRWRGTPIIPALLERIEEYSQTRR